MPLSLREVLALDAVRAGAPVVVAALDRLDVPVRWVHAAELTDVGRLLRGGELVLSTGIALPAAASGLAEYVASLAGAGVAGLAIELGQRYAGELPPALVTAAEARGVPLIAFEREVPFVEITEAVHARIIDAQMAELLSAQRVHSVFTALSVEGAPPAAIVRAAADLAGRTVILADMSYRVLAGAGPDAATAGAGRAGKDSAGDDTTGNADEAGSGEGVPAGFAARARAACEGRPRTFHAESEGWLVTTVGARGEDWGRLFLILACPGEPSPAAPSPAEPSPAAPSPAEPSPAQPSPTPEDTVLLERAATTLALGRLLARQAESVERQAHRTLISAIIEDTDPAAATARARAMGVPVTGRQLVALVARLPDAGPGLSAHALVLDAAEAIADACRDSRVPALVSSLDDVRVGALLSLPAQADTDRVLRQLCSGLAAALDASTPIVASDPASPVVPVIGVGSPATGMAEARRSFLDAREAAEVARRHLDRDRQREGRPYYRLPDLRLRGLLHMLRDDPRLTAFADREIGPLLTYDAAHGTRLAADLATYLEAGGNKAAAATRAHLARPTFYQRLQLIEHVLGVSLDSAESRASLHVALLALSPRHP
ncbi:MAG TPA: PucR family transcriptional regulator ligand-binding domain-containing protein [Trebonia sp.]|nr:PucR family transcriptional regulator ligand-binding domain-containing protein [Trebonia sp.]